MADILLRVTGRADDEGDVRKGLVVQQIRGPGDETVAVTVYLIKEER